MDSNHYLDTNIQKAFQSHVAGCEEHQLKLASVIKYANQHQWSLAIAWLDLANSYGRLTTNSFSLRQMESLDITPLDLVSKPETMSQGGTKPYLWQPVITSPVIQQRMEEPQAAVSPWLGLISVAYWWSGRLVTLPGSSRVPGPSLQSVWESAGSHHLHSVGDISCRPFGGDLSRRPLSVSVFTPPSTYCWIVLKVLALMLVIASLPVWESFPSCSMLMTPVWQPRMPRNASRCSKPQRCGWIGLEWNLKFQSAEHLDSTVELPNPPFLQPLAISLFWGDTFPWQRYHPLPRHACY